MTTTPVDQPFETFLVMTADALQGAIESAIEGDPRRARAVRRSRGSRHSALVAAQARLRHEASPHGSRRLTSTIAALQCLDEVHRAGELADGLALSVVRGGAGSAPEWLRVLSSAASQRLACLGRVHAPAMEAGYVSCGCELRAVAEHRAADGDTSVPTVLCAEIARAVLAASTYAARA